MAAGIPKLIPIQHAEKSEHEHRRKRAELKRPDDDRKKADLLDGVRMAATIFTTFPELGG